MGSRKTKEQFIQECTKLFNGYYDYSLVEYVNNNTKVKIICPKHGIFEQIPRSHTSGIGCSKCGRDSTGDILRMTNKEFIERSTKIHKGYYNYDKVVYIRNQENVIITCPVHGDFLQTPYSHLKGCGCKKCADERTADTHRNTTEYFIERARKVHGNRYDYSRVQYKNAESKVEIICKKHGVFTQQVWCHLYGKGCPNCANSKGEDLVKAYLDENKIDYVQQKNFYRL